MIAAALPESSGVVTTVSMDVAVRRWTTDGAPLSSLELRVPDLSWHSTVHSLQPGESRVTRTGCRLEVSPRGDRVLTVGGDGGARTWVTTREELDRLLAQRTLRDLTADEREAYGALLGDAAAE